MNIASANKIKKVIADKTAFLFKAPLKWLKVKLIKVNTARRASAAEFKKPIGSQLIAQTVSVRSKANTQLAITRRLGKSTAATLKNSLIKSMDATKIPANLKRKVVSSPAPQKSKNIS